MNKCGNKRQYHRFEEFAYDSVDFLCMSKFIREIFFLLHRKKCRRSFLFIWTGLKVEVKFVKGFGGQTNLIDQFQLLRTHGTRKSWH